MISNNNNILSNLEIESIIENVTNIIKNKITKQVVIKNELEETNISIINLPIVKSIIYKYEEELKNIYVNKNNDDKQYVLFLENKIFHSTFAA